MKNVASGLVFLNGENEYPESHSVIEKGVEWEYENDNDKETLQTTGPLRHGILIMVRTKNEQMYFGHTQEFSDGHKILISSICR